MSWKNNYNRCRYFLKSNCVYKDFFFGPKLVRLLAREYTLQCTTNTNYPNNIIYPYISTYVLCTLLYNWVCVTRQIQKLIQIRTSYIYIYTKYTKFSSSLKLSKITRGLSLIDKTSLYTSCRVTISQNVFLVNFTYKNVSMCVWVYLDLSTVPLNKYIQTQLLCICIHKQCWSKIKLHIHIYRHIYGCRDMLYVKLWKISSIYVYFERFFKN